MMERLHSTDTLLAGMNGVKVAEGEVSDRKRQLAEKIKDACLTSAVCATAQESQGRIAALRRKLSNQATEERPSADIPGVSHAYRVALGCIWMALRLYCPPLVHFPRRASHRGEHRHVLRGQPPTSGSRHDPGAPAYYNGPYRATG